MSIAELLNHDGPAVLHTLAVLSIMLGGMAIMVGLRRWGARLVGLGVFLAAASTFV